MGNGRAAGRLAPRPGRPPEGVDGVGPPAACRAPYRAAGPHAHVAAGQAPSPAACPPDVAVELARHIYFHALEMNSILVPY